MACNEEEEGKMLLCFANICREVTQQRPVNKYVYKHMKNIYGLVFVSFRYKFLLTWLTTINLHTFIIIVEMFFYRTEKPLVDSYTNNSKQLSFICFIFFCIFFLFALSLSFKSFCSILQKTQKCIPLTLKATNIILFID